MATKVQPITAEAEVNHFKAIPWCAEHLIAPNLIVRPGFSRSVKPNFEDAFWSQTLKTEDTVPAFVVFYPRPEDDSANLPEIKAFVTLGMLVSGNTGIAHGGMLAALLDEVLASVIRMTHAPGGPIVVTAYLNTRFLRPVIVPETYLVVVKLTKVEGRKIFTDGFIQSKTGEKVAEADALFVEVRQKL